MFYINLSIFPALAYQKYPKLQRSKNSSSQRSLLQQQQNQQQQMELKKKKNEFNSKLIFKIKFITAKDYEELNPYEAIIYDRRSFLTLFFDRLIEENILMNLFFCDSLMQPLWIRLGFFYFNLSLTFAFNAFFFSDDYIDARVDLPHTLTVN